MRQAVERNAVRIDRPLDGQKVDHGSGLVEQFIDGLLAGTRHRLIGGHHNASNAEFPVDRIQGDHHLNRRAVGIGDDSLLRILGHGVRVDLGHYQRNLGVHAPGARVVDHDATVLGGMRSESLAGTAAGRKKRDVDALERSFGQLLDFDGVSPELQLAPDGARRRQQGQTLDRKVHLLETGDHLVADRPGRSNHSHVKLFRSHFIPPEHQIPPASRQPCDPDAIAVVSA